MRRWSGKVCGRYVCGFKRHRQRGVEATGLPRCSHPRVLPYIQIPPVLLWGAGRRWAVGAASGGGGLRRPPPPTTRAKWAEHTSDWALWAPPKRALRMYSAASRLLCARGQELDTENTNKKRTAAGVAERRPHQCRVGGPPGRASATCSTASCDSTLPSNAFLKVVLKSSQARDQPTAVTPWGCKTSTLAERWRGLCRETGARSTARAPTPRGSPRPRPGVAVQHQPQRSIGGGRLWDLLPERAGSNTQPTRRESQRTAAGEGVGRGAGREARRGACRLDDQG